MPATREEALALLGLSAGATEPVIRKVVEALRQSWHPDLAADDADREAREERIKAINVAADLLLRKSAA
jgi:DnaJ-class molecular chaperone